MLTGIAQGEGWESRAVHVVTSPCRLQQHVLHRIKPQTCGVFSLFHVYFHEFLLSPTYQLKFPTHKRNKILGK